VGSDKGGSTLQNGEPRSVPSQGLPSIHIRSLFLDAAGTVWAGTDKGAAKYEDGAFVEPREFVRNVKGPVVAIAETRDHRVLLAVEHGNVYAYSDGKLSIVQDQNEGGPLLTNIISLHSDSDGYVWMGTNGVGLRLLRDRRVSRFFMRDGLFDNEIYGFASDSRGRLWITGSKGFYSVVKADLLAFADGKISKFKSSPYVPMGVLRAIQGKRGVSPNAIASRDGKLWFSTVGGLIAYDPNQGTGTHPPLPVLIEDANVNGVRTQAGNIGKIGPGVENVSFHYTGISFLDPQNMMFRYILEGYDRDWTNAGARREAFYTNLPAGHFRFRVAACAPFVPCSDAGAPAELEVIPHLYQRTWFIFLVAAVLLGLVFAVYRFRMSQIETQFSLVVAERTRIARELHDTLIQGFAGITMQLQALSEELPSAERESLSDIISDAGNCLRETRQSVAGLRDEEQSSPGLKKAIVEAAGRISHGNMRIQFDLEESQYELAPGTKYNLLLILQEAVMNAVRHSGADLVEVSLRNMDDGELVLSVSDHGRGADQLSADDKQGHFGIIGMRERAGDMGAEFKWNSIPGVGTTVRVQLPNKKSTPFLNKLSQVRTN